MMKAKKTARRKMTDDLRGVVVHGLTGFAESGLSFLVSKMAPNYICLVVRGFEKQFAMGALSTV